MITKAIKKIFNIRDGELKIALLMQGYIFFIITTLLIIKPTVNSLFISEVGAENLPFGYLLVAITAVISSFFYARATERFSLLRIIRFTLALSILSLFILGTLLYLNLIKGWLLYGFYIGVAIYAVLATSQFWVLANLVFNIREAKRLFGFIGAGAIAGGIFGGYLTTVLAPLIGNENLIFVASLFLVLCFPLLAHIWKTKVLLLNSFKQKKRIASSKESPFKLVLGSKHLTYLAAIIGIGVITAKLVDYTFSYIAAERITDSDELTSFFGFWLSSFNVVSLLLQLFLTRRIVGVWGVGFSLLILPVLVFMGGLLFFVFPELWVVILLRAIDTSFKQSINRSAVELIALPLPFQLKRKTKSFIDVVVDSIATGVAGCILIFLIKGLDVSPKYIIMLIVLLTFVWAYFVFKLRTAYFLSFRKNLNTMASHPKKRETMVSKESFIKGMRHVFQQGEEREILYMLGKTLEINDRRLESLISKLLYHPSNKVKTAALQNLFFLNNRTIYLEVQQLLHSEDDEVVLAALEYLLLHADTSEDIVFDKYLNHPNERLANAALICLAKESRDNQSLKKKYHLYKRIQEKAFQIEELEGAFKTKFQIELLEIIGFSDYKDGYMMLLEAIESDDLQLQKAAILAAGNTMNQVFIQPILEKMINKEQRETVIKALLQFDEGMLPILRNNITATEVTLQIKQFIPKVMAAFNSQSAVNTLIVSFKEAQDLSVRLECVTALAKLKEENISLHFNEREIAKLILEECKLYDSTISAMHTQIIVHYLRRKKLKQLLSENEMQARESLMELLERRLENGLNRIFKLLELRYASQDIRMAYEGILSEEHEKRTNAIEFLDMLLTPSLKGALIPIVEATILDTSSEEVIEMISKSKITEFDCFRSILEGRDLKLKLAVLYLIQQMAHVKYLPLLETLVDSYDDKVKSFARNAMNTIHVNIH
ncbi:NTP/NDP exchange transporter [Flavivirga sp. 57AJ16]|uniref:NTP/NDP exchange transporter n=1 Tax=Flavivirga sp. 57AJ16 TaxID=3025307 RepID=UPI002366943F|nr:Npt1/Npt2 family nucleotide transporter [Flavivirga sp. 57AJ16]MDD7885031.1 Npt1/Npt2 family nucleotide transporter [Flavivirga sp. 57AJ16]